MKCIPPEMKDWKGGFRQAYIPKTVYDPQIYTDERMLAWGKEAMSNGNIDGATVSGTSTNGVTFKGVISSNTGKIENFYP